MLEESKELFDKLKKATQEQQFKKAKRKAFLVKFKKRTIIVIIAVIIVASLIFPKETGTVIGTWIHDFFGTIIKESIK